MIRIAIAIGAVLALLAGLWKIYHTGYTSGKAEVTAEWQAESAKAQEAARKREQELSTKATEALNAARKRETANRTAANAAAAESDRLRDTLAKRERELSESSPAACLEYVTAANSVLRDLEAEGRGLAEKADGHASDALACVQGWPR
jgi:hypothetical protein